jgi:hypothetical protein
MGLEKSRRVASRMSPSLPILFFCVQESFPTLSISEKAGWTRMPTGAALSVLPCCEFGKDSAGLRDWVIWDARWAEQSVDVDNKRHWWCLVVFRRSTMGERNETTSQAIAVSKKGHILSICITLYNCITKIKTGSKIYNA